VARGAVPVEPSDDGPLWRAARARIGRALNEKWHLDELLGVGGVAAVYAATHRNGRRVAIKIMHAETAVDPESRSRFLREGYVANRVGHPGVVCALDDDVSEDGAPFLVMELLDGETIQARWERKGKVLQAGEVLSIADQLLDVLAVAHDRGVIHRDVKPANLFLTRTGVIKLLDFGLARASSEHGQRTLTLTGASPMGTPAFMPPEQALARSDEVDGRTDLWAVGATMLTLTSGRHVHQARSVTELLLAAMTKPAAQASSVLPGIAPEVAKIIDRALEFDQANRWQDARAMQLAVREAYQAWLSMTETLRMRRPRARATRSVVDGMLGALRIVLAALIGVAWGSQMVRPPSTSAAAHPSATGGVRGRAEAASAAIIIPTSEPRTTAPGAPTAEEPSMEDLVMEPLAPDRPAPPHPPPPPPRLPRTERVN